MSCQLKPLNKQSHSYCYPGWVMLLSGLSNNSRYNVTALPKKQKKELRPSLNLCVSEINLTEVEHFVHWTSAAIYNLHPLFLLWPTEGGYELTVDRTTGRKLDCRLSLTYRKDFCKPLKREWKKWEKKPQKKPRTPSRPTVVPPQSVPHRERRDNTGAQMFLPE